MKNLFTLMLLFSFLTIVAQDEIYVHTATAENSVLQVTFIDHPALNGNPDAGLVFAHNWNPPGSPGIYNNNVTGLWYSEAEEKWTIFNENTDVDIVEGSSYNVYICSNPDNVITHIATAANQGTIDAYTVIDDDNLNSSNPGPYAIMSNYWNPNSVYNNYNYGFWYDEAAERRIIYTEGIITIPENAAFKILINGEGVTARFTHVASEENNEFNYTVIDHPSLNGNPNATFVFTHYWGVNGDATMVSLDAVLGVWYSGTNWSIYREDTTDDVIPIGMAFDIIVAPQSTVGINEVALEAEVFVSPNPTTNFVTITSKDVISDITLFNNTGRKILYFDGTGNSMQIDLSDYSPGIYMAKVRVGDAEKTIKLIKQ